MSEEARHTFKAKQLLCGEFRVSDDTLRATQSHHDRLVELADLTEYEVCDGGVLHL
jgi:hypothetical protein